MKKYESINMNPKLIKHGGRKAIKTSIDELKQHIIEFSKKYLEEDEVNEYLNYEPDYNYCPYTGLILAIYGLGETLLNKDVYNLYMENVDTSKKNDLIGFRTLDNGFTFLGISGCADYNNASYFIIYYDGKNIRGYVPKYGNTVIVDCKGFENEFGEQWEAEEKHYKKWYKSPELFNLTNDEIKKVNEQIKIDCDNSFSIFLDKLEKKDINIPKFKFGQNITFEEFKKIPAPIAYRLANGYPLSGQIGYADDINWAAIETDIKARIEVY